MAEEFVYLVLRTDRMIFLIVKAVDFIACSIELKLFYNINRCEPHILPFCVCENM